MQIIDEFEIEGFQNCQQYIKINPISILITDPKFKINCCFMRMDINIDLLQIAFYLACQYKKIQTIFITTNGFNDAKDILINGKLFQGLE